MARKTRKHMEDIVAEVGRYPLESFVFVQECLSFAADRVHGPMSTDEAAVAQWMAINEVDPLQLQRRTDAGDLPPDIMDALKRMGGSQKMNRHVTGQQLCEAVRAKALQRWGLLARPVLTRWNVTCTEDIGHIVFALVNNGWLQKQPSDRLEDFDQVFSFQEAFDSDYRILTTH